jgi:hypothetical protein
LQRKGLKGIKISTNKDIDTFSADDQFIVTDSEDAQQTSIQKLGRFTSKNGLNIPISKTKTMVFKGRDQVRN